MKDTSFTLNLLSSDINHVLDSLCWDGTTASAHLVGIVSCMQPIASTKNLMHMDEFNAHVLFDRLRHGVGVAAAWSAIAAARSSGFASLIDL
jgi:hypothetical protein